MSNKNIVILGVFVADTAYRASRQPQIGETLSGNEFSLGPGGKGSNQAVAGPLAFGKIPVSLHMLRITPIATLEQHTFLSKKAPEIMLLLLVPEQLQK